jgi:hypothetical protein
VGASPLEGLVVDDVRAENGHRPSLRRTAAGSRCALDVVSRTGDGVPGWTT